MKRPREVAVDDEPVVTKRLTIYSHEVGYNFFPRPITQVMNMILLGYPNSSYKIIQRFHSRSILIGPLGQPLLPILPILSIFILGRMLRSMMFTRVEQLIDHMDGAVKADNIAHMSNVVVNDHFGLDHRWLVGSRKSESFLDNDHIQCVIRQCCL